MSVELWFVPRDELGQVWEKVVGFLESACQKGPLPTTTEELRKACKSGNCQLWIAKRRGEILAAAVTEIVKGLDYNTLMFLSVGGSEMRAWLHFERLIAKQAKQEMNVSVVRTICRPGVVRRIEPMGYRIKGYVMERHL